MMILYCLDYFTMFLHIHRQNLSTIDWDSMFTSNAIDYITCSIRQTITDIVNDTIPNIIICIRKDNPPWLTAAITNQIRRKKKFINGLNRRT
jgi:hypothetical protein